MKRIIASLLVLLTLISIPSLSAADTASLALQADSAYNREDYRAAIDLYRAAIAADGPSTVVYYNLGNAYYRNDNIGKAVVAYERALRIDPTNDQARQNLSFVRSRIQDRPEDDSTFLANLHRSIRNSMHANGWAVAALVIFALLLGAVALYIFAPGVTLRKTGFFGGVVLVFVFIYALVLARDSAAPCPLPRVGSGGGAYDSAQFGATCGSLRRQPRCANPRRHHCGNRRLRCHSRRPRLAHVVLR